MISKFSLSLLLLGSIVDKRRYALNGASFKINIFLGDVLKESFSGSESENFVASVYNFSSSLSSSGCGNCHQQKAEGVKCIAQVPATVPIRHHIINSREAPELVYVVLNSLGKVNISIILCLCSGD